MRVNDGGHPWLAAILDVSMRPMYAARRFVVPHARGRVLEIGVGTGLNFDLYDTSVVELVGVEPDPHMLRRARPRAGELPFPATLHQVGGERLPFESASFDTVVITFTLCTIPEPEPALAEVRRVLKPEGALLFLEHTRAPGRTMARMQDVIAPAWRRVFGGCHPNRDAVTMVREAGFAVEGIAPIGRERWNPLPVYRGVGRPLHAPARASLGTSS
jgi:ubiquinone/menaquinone biosynthesis C-methylase UbiE